MSRYRDRLGRIITDPESIERRRLLSLLRRRMTLGLKLDRHWPKLVTAGELAATAKVSVDAILEWADGTWLIGHIETDGPKETWWVYEDGE